MQFPNRDRMTEEECLANANAAKDLTPGLHYRFDPAVEATGIPTGGPEAFAPRQFHFSRGWYLTAGEGNTLLDIQTRGVFRQGAILTIRSAVNADLAIFAYYLVHVRQQEEAAAVAASGSVAATS